MFAYLRATTWDTPILVPAVFAYVPSATFRATATTKFMGAYGTPFARYA